MTHQIESGEVKAEQQRRQQQPVVLPLKKRRRPKPEKSAQANGGSSSSATGSSSLSRTSSSSPLSGNADGKGQQQQQQHEQGGKKPRLVWTTELHDLFVEAYDSLGDEAVPRRILEKMNEKMNIPEISREKVASHLQKHKLHLRRLAEEASPTKEAPAGPHSHPLRPLPRNTTPLAEVSQASQLELVQQQLLQEPPDCLSRSGSSLAANLQIVQSIHHHQQQQQLCAPPIKEVLTDSADCSLVGMESSIAAILVPAEAINTEKEEVIRMVQAANTENAAEAEEAAPAPGSILEQFWASPDNEAGAASTSSWDIFVLPRGT